MMPVSINNVRRECRIAIMSNIQAERSTKTAIYSRVEPINDSAEQKHSNSYECSRPPDDQNGGGPFTERRVKREIESQNIETESAENDNGAEKERSRP